MCENINTPAPEIPYLDEEEEKILQTFKENCIREISYDLVEKMRQDNKIAEVTVPAIGHIIDFTDTTGTVIDYDEETKTYIVEDNNDEEHIMYVPYSVLENSQVIEDSTFYSYYRIWYLDDRFNGFFKDYDGIRKLCNLGFRVFTCPYARTGYIFSGYDSPDADYTYLIPLMNTLHEYFAQVDNNKSK